MILIDRPKNGWSHMVGTTPEELHKFAQKLLIGRHWYEGSRKNRPHYDVHQRDFDDAVSAGAVVVSSKEIVNFLKENYETT